MNVSNLTYPESLDQPSRKRVTIFKENIWRNAEVCNNCFQQIRSIGPVRERQLTESAGRALADGHPQTITVNDWHERTELGSQEHTRWDTNKRFGTCFCLACGADGGAETDTVSIDDLKTFGRRIVRFLNTQTRYHCPPDRFGRVLGRLCTIDENSGLDTEKLAVSTAHSLRSAHPNHPSSAASPRAD